MSDLKNKFLESRNNDCYRVVVECFDMLDAELIKSRIIFMNPRIETYNPDAEV